MLEHGLLIYDGDCKFCQLSLDFALRKLENMPKYVAFQRINPSDFGLTAEQVRQEIWLFRTGHDPLGGHRAIAELFSSQKKRFWRLLGKLMQLAPIDPIAASVYRWVARHRHQLPGGSKECQLKDTFDG